MGQGHEGPLFLRVCLKRKVSCNGILRFRATAFLVLPMSHVPGLQALFLTTLFRTCVMRKREGYRTTVRPTEAASVLQSRRRRSYSSWRRRAVGYSTSVPARVYVPAVLAQRSAFSFPPAPKGVTFRKKKITWKGCVQSPDVSGGCNFHPIAHSLSFRPYTITMVHGAGTRAQQ